MQDSATPVGRRFSRKALQRSVIDLAPDLLGAVLVRGEVSIRLTEVEAYAGSDDPGSHAFRGRTARNEVMFGRAGGLYVYFTYGMHWCANVVAGPAGEPGAVLLRAGEVVTGHDVVAARKGAVPQRDWARGPARLAVALGLDGDDDGMDLCARDAAVQLRRGSAPVDPRRIRTGPRVGVAGPGGDGSAYPWRFWLEGEPTVSAYRPAKPRRAPRGV